MLTVSVVVLAGACRVEEMIGLRIIVVDEFEPAAISSPPLYYLLKWRTNFHETEYLNESWIRDLLVGNVLS